MKQHVVIAGGGIVGCFTAMELIGRGYRVTIVERNKIASQTSGESSWAGGGILFPLLTWMYSDAVNLLTSYGKETYPAICRHLHQATGVDPHYEQSGMLLLPEFDIKLAQSWCIANQMPYQQVSAKAFGVQSLNGEQSLWLPSVGQIRPPYLMQALRIWLEQNNVTLLEQTELMPLKQHQEIHAWQTTQGEVLTADKFVVTSGAWSFELLKDTVKHLNIKPMRGQILLYKPKENLQQIVYCDGFYMIPRRDGYLLAGSTLEDVGFDTNTTVDVREALRVKAEAIMPALKGESIIKHWSGLRPGTPENLPTISAHPHIKNLYLNTGHFRYGLTMAPASARLMADLISGNTPWIDVEPFSLKD